MTRIQYDYNWLQNIIDSANNDFHFDCVDKLVDLFHSKHNNAPLTTCLQEQRAIHWNNIHSILI